MTQARPTRLAALLAAVAFAGLAALSSAPAAAADVRIGDMHTTVSTSGGLSAATLKGLVDAVVNALEQQARDKDRRQRDQQPQ